MTCNDCLHKRVCEMRHGPTPIGEIPVYMREDIEHECLCFIDSSRFTMLPCNVGDKIFIIKRTRGLFVRGAIVDSITFRSD